VGGGRIADGDIIEVVVYSEKTRTVLGEGPAFGCDVIDTLVVNGQTQFILSSCWFDFLSQQRIIYRQGVLDQVRNSGSAYASSGSSSTPRPRPARSTCRARRSTRAVIC
jgi:hypothetical protein